MITDLKLLIETCRNEMHDREYTGHHADMINKEWISVLNITVQMYPCSEGTDTDSPAL